MPLFRRMSRRASHAAAVVFAQHRQHAAKVLRQLRNDFDSIAVQIIKPNPLGVQRQPADQRAFVLAALGSIIALERAEENSLAGAGVVERINCQRQAD